ncbi:hypothetical protein D3C85_1590990 [compost metagenome]
MLENNDEVDLTAEKNENQHSHNHSNIFGKMFHFVLLIIHIQLECSRISPNESCCKSRHEAANAYQFPGNISTQGSYYHCNGSVISEET